jgi:serine/threonine protein kinase
MIPEKILDYKIKRLIGEGGMAKVYEADLDSKLGTKVAIKVLDRHLASDESLKERFRQEAKSMLKLKHPYIVNVLNFVEEENTLAIVMEYIEGQSLNEMVESNGPVIPEHTEQIFTRVLEAMQYVHDKGMVHRDIKPSNIFIIEGKYPKILDFGIVKVLEGGGTNKTKTGLTIGTPMYMSPEQIQTPQNIDYRTDIYSLGVTLYYMLAGNPPYDYTESEFGIQTKVVKEPLPILPNIPSNLTNAISMATLKNREERMSNCNMFIEALKKQIIVNNEKTKIIDSSATSNNFISSPKSDIDWNEFEGYLLKRLGYYKNDDPKRIFLGSNIPQEWKTMVLEVIDDNDEKIIGIINSSSSKNTLEEGLVFGKKCFLYLNTTKGSQYIEWKEFIDYELGVIEAKWFKSEKTCIGTMEIDMAYLKITSWAIISLLEKIQSKIRKILN